MSRRLFARAATTITGAMLVLVTLMGPACSGSDGVAAMTKRVDTALPPGSSRASINAFLDANDFRYGETYRARDYSYVTDAGIDPDARVMAALANHVHSGSIVKCRLQVYFILDESDTLHGRLVRSVCTGP